MARRLGLPFTTSSLAKLAEHLASQAWNIASTETVRKTLRAAGITWQAKRIWNTSREPDFVVKRDRILAPTIGRRSTDE